MPFDHFTNPFENPANIPELYRNHPALQQLFKQDGSYARPAEDPVTMWAINLLHEKYYVPLEVMALEYPVDASEGTHQQGRRWLGYVDLVIYDDRYICLLYTSPSPRDRTRSRMPSSA